METWAPEVIKRIVVVSLFLLFFSQPAFRLCYAGSAEVIPRGVHYSSLNGKFYLPIDTRFDPDGNEEDVATDFNANLNSNVFSALSLVEAGFGMPPGSATIGTSVVSFEYDFTYLEFFYQPGITDKLTAGAMIPFISPEYPAGSSMISDSLKTKNPQSFLNTGAVVWSSGR